MVDILIDCLQTKRDNMSTKHKKSTAKEKEPFEKKRTKIFFSFSFWIH